MEKKKRKREGKKNFRRKLRGNTAYRGQCGMENFRARGDIIVWNQGKAIENPEKEGVVLGSFSNTNSIKSRLVLCKIEKWPSFSTKFGRVNYFLGKY